MRVTYSLAALAGVTLGRPSPEPRSLAPRAVAYVDSETGFTFAETKAAATLSNNIVYRIAVPANVPANSNYDVVIQVVAPNSLGWVGLAWGGSMIKNPLTVAYPNGQKPTVSSRWATGATYTALTAGNKSNGTHWQYTVKCTGCTTYTGSSGGITRISPTGTTRFGYACASGKVSNPSSTTATIPTHDVYNYVSHDFSAGQNANFAALLLKNGVTDESGSANATQAFE
ncbi:hypothetical protein N0V83_002694 [Neocucurbitaria cava]|uniref:Cellobiose dehydrogenase-like cytochrome domain-containing protein n=1 Tax=Neocucurbitaria cava TaxID=798079 RepID=A0A9W8YC01_9PLEO|nr:hypothetical protein N0V83_002694 [Neocucurbitaria cava]